jgi:nicotinamide-nucleotide amidase
MPLDVHEPTIERLRERAARRGMSMPAINQRMALVPRGAALIDNPNGAAPGLWIERGSTAVVVLPGPPREMTPMIEAVVRERLAARSGGAGLFRRVLKITGRTESEVDTDAQPCTGPGPRRPFDRRRFSPLSARSNYT